jgi:hypothetical protein
MKKIITILTFSITIFGYSQSYLSEPAQFNEYQAPGNLDLINNVLAQKQRSYDNSRKTSCNSLIESVISLADSTPYLAIKTSTMFSGVRYYQYQGRGYLIVYVKDDEYDINDEDDRAYIYCGITQQRWEYFVEYGENTSWGKSYDYYIKNFTCGCR